MYYWSVVDLRIFWYRKLDIVISEETKETLEECTDFSIDGIDIARFSNILMAFAVYLYSFNVFNWA